MSVANGIRFRRLTRPWGILLMAMMPILQAACEARSAEDRDDGSKGGAPTSAEATWSRPRTAERSAERARMVKGQLVSRGIRDRRVLDAMGSVPRHWFVPDSMAGQAYVDSPLPIGQGQTISQPYIVAFMTEALKLDKDDKVLEIGTGSGYQAAVLAEITPNVYTIEIVEPLGRRAAETFERRGYETIRARIGDGYEGWPKHAPFDAIIVTCAPEKIPPKLIEQLKPRGQLCIPVGRQGGVQKLVLVTKLIDGSLARKDLLAVRFVPMTGGD